MIKTLSEPGEELPQLDKYCLQKPTANITLGGEKLEAFPLSGTGQRCCLAALLNIILKSLLIQDRRRQE